MSVELSYAANLTVKETLADTFLSTKDKAVTHDGLNRSLTLNASSTPAATKVVSFEKALSGGAGTIDLTSLPGTNGATISANGLKVRACKFRNKSSNGNDITIEPGASNGIDLFGAGFSLTLKPDQEVTFYLKDGATAVGGSDKTLDLTGTDAQVLQCLFVFG